MIGRLGWATDRRDVFVSVTAQLPLAYHRAASDSLTFTAETWANIHEVISLRGRGEILLGWWHLHPNWCRDCPPERCRRCRLSTPFFSGADVQVHHACFSRAYQVALLVTERPEETVVTLFAWQRGLIAEQPFYVVAEDDGRIGGRLRPLRGAGSRSRNTEAMA